MKKLLFVLSLAALTVFAPARASALVIGYYLSGTTGSPAAAITAAGHTAQALAGLGGANLSGIDVLWILNGINGSPDAQILGNTAAISTFVSGGGVLSFHDRNVTQGVDADTYLPGAGGVAFTTDFGTDLNVLANNTVTNGPA